MVEKIPLEGGGFAVDPVELINAADNELGKKIAEMLPDDMEPVVMLSTIARVIAYIAVNRAPDFESIEAGINLVMFMINVNARMAWDVQHPKEENDGNRVH